VRQHRIKVINKIKIEITVEKGSFTLESKTIPFIYVVVVTSKET